MEREVKMNVDANGRKRLEAMKRALAAGVPLAGLLAGMACTSQPVTDDGRLMGVPIPPSEEYRVMGKRPPRAVIGEEGRAKNLMGVGLPEGTEIPAMPAGEGEKATGSRE